MKALPALLVLGLLPACTEKPQRLEQSSTEAAKADQSSTERRQRTLGQSESDRIYQQGTLR